jgi:hypothetical protein
VGYEDGIIDVKESGDPEDSVMTVYGEAVEATSVLDSEYLSMI